MVLSQKSRAVAMCVAFVVCTVVSFLIGDCRSKVPPAVHAEEMPVRVFRIPPGGGYPEIIWRGPDGSELRINFNGSKFHAVASDPP